MLYHDQFMIRLIGVIGARWLCIVVDRLATVNAPGILCFVSQVTLSPQSFPRWCPPRIIHTYPHLSCPGYPLPVYSHRIFMPIPIVSISYPFSVKYFVSSSLSPYINSFGFSRSIFRIRFLILLIRCRSVSMIALSCFPNRIRSMISYRLIIFSNEKAREGNPGLF